MATPANNINGAPKVVAKLKFAQPACHEAPNSRLCFICERATFEHLYQFPIHDKELYEKWIKNINDPRLFKLKPEDVFKKYRICQKHFRFEDIDVSGKLLKPGAAPTIYIYRTLKSEIIPDKNKTKKPNETQGKVCYTNNDLSVEHDYCTPTIEKEIKKAKKDNWVDKNINDDHRYCDPRLIGEDLPVIPRDRPVTGPITQELIDKLYKEHIETNRIKSIIRDRRRRPKKTNRPYTIRPKDANNPPFPLVAKEFEFKKAKTMTNDFDDWLKNYMDRKAKLGGISLDDCKTRESFTLSVEIETPEEPDTDPLSPVSVYEVLEESEESTNGVPIKENTGSSPKKLMAPRTPLVANTNAISPYQSPVERSNMKSVQADLDISPIDSESVGANRNSLLQQEGLDFRKRYSEPLVIMQNDTRDLELTVKHVIRQVTDDETLGKKFYLIEVDNYMGSPNTIKVQRVHKVHDKENESNNNNNNNNEIICSEQDVEHKFEYVKSLGGLSVTKISPLPLSSPDPKPKVIEKLKNSKIKPLYTKTCQYCDKVFRYSCELNKHLSKHKGYPYECLECNTAFYSEGAFKRHNRKVHDPIKAVTCELCKKVFSMPAALKLHIERNTCQNESPLPADLDSSICDICDKCCGTELRMILHRNHHLQPRIQCDECGEMILECRLKLHKAHKHSAEGQQKKVTEPCEICNRQITVSRMKYHWKHTHFFDLPLLSENEESEEETNKAEEAEMVIEKDQVIENQDKLEEEFNPNGAIEMEIGTEENAENVETEETEENEETEDDRVAQKENLEAANNLALYWQQSFKDFLIES